MDFDYRWSPCVLFSSSSRVCGPEDAYNGESLIAGRCHRCSLQGGRVVWVTWCSLQTDALLSGVPSLQVAPRRRLGKAFDMRYTYAALSACDCVIG